MTSEEFDGVGAEVWLLGYLLFIGVKTAKPAKRVLAAIAMPGAQA